MRSTRTHTQYFSDDQTEAIKAEVAKLREDFESRRMYISSEAEDAMETRMALLEGAVALLTDPAD